MGLFSAEFYSDGIQSCDAGVKYSLTTVRPTISCGDKIFWYTCCWIW